MNLRRNRSPLINYAIPSHLLYPLLYLLFFLNCSVGLAQNTADGILFDAEDAVIKGYDKKNQIIELRKKVQIIHNGQFVSCDVATIDTQRGLIICKGNVRLVSPEAKLEAEKIELNYKNNTGEIFNGFVQIGQVLFEGENIKKLSENKYQTTRGRYTACTTCPPFWSFKGSKVDAEIGGYAYIKNAIIYFGPIPALWFPYLVIPLKSERQTGLLFPNYGYSDSDGFTLEESFFWAMSENQDSTWTAKYYANRGTKGVVNYRYVLSDETNGEFSFGYMKDRYFSNEADLATFNPSRDQLTRWFAKYDHQYYLPYGFIQRMSINAVSDTRYPKDFDKEMPGWGDPSLENRISLTKNTDYSHWSLDTSYYRSLLNENPLQSNYTSVHRFPEMNYSIVPMHILNSNFLFNLHLNYINFARDNIGYDDLDGNKQPLNAPDGSYDPTTDLIRTGQRLDIEPSITYPINFGKALYLTPTVSYRETRYQFPLGERPSTYRHYVRTNLSMGTHFSKIFSDDGNPISDRYKHVLQPEVSYTTLPWVEQPNHPFFASTEFDPNFKKDQPVNNSDNIQFDYRDRVFEKNILTYSLTNKILRKKWTDGSPEYRQILRHKLSQSYDIHEENRRTTSDKQPWSEISSLLNIRLDYFETNSIIKHFPYQKDTKHSTTVRFFSKKRDYLQLTYSQDFLITNGSLDLTSKTRDITPGLGFNYKYMLFSGETTYNLLKDRYQSYKYLAQFKPPGNCWSIVFSHERKTGSEAQYDFNISFLFDGKSDVALGGL